MLLVPKGSITITQSCYTFSLWTINGRKADETCKYQKSERWTTVKIK